MEFLPIEIREKNTNQIISTCSLMDIFTFQVITENAWHIAITRSQVSIEANREDYKYVIRES